jgi:hypothetical protein
MMAISDAMQPKHEFQPRGDVGAPVEDAVEASTQAFWFGFPGWLCLRSLKSFIKQQPGSPVDLQRASELRGGAAFASEGDGMQRGARRRARRPD